MGNIVITKEREHSWDVIVYDNKGPVRRAWAMNRDQAIGKAEILADFYRDDNGQSGSIIINEA